MLLGFFISVALALILAIIVTFAPLYFKEVDSSDIMSENSDFEKQCKYIQSFLNISEGIKVDEVCHIGVGYSSNVDWNIDANHFFKIYEGKNSTKNLVPTEHEIIDTHQKFLETFLYFFREGASSERIAVNPKLIQDISRIFLIL